MEKREKRCRGSPAPELCCCWELAWQAVASFAGRCSLGARTNAVFATHCFEGSPDSQAVVSPFFMDHLIYFGHPARSAPRRRGARDGAHADGPCDRRPCTGQGGSSRRFPTIGA